MWPNSRLVTAERDGYFEICRSPRPNPGEGEVFAREQHQTAYGHVAYGVSAGGAGTAGAGMAAAPASGAVF